MLTNEQKEEIQNWSKQFLNPNTLPNDLKKDPEFWFKMIEVCLENKKHTEAADCAYEAAILYQDNMQYAKAAVSHEKVAMITNALGDWQYAGYYYSNINQYDKTAACYEKVAMITDTLGDWQYAGYCYFITKHDEKAAVCFEKAAMITNDHDDWQRAGYCYFCIKHYEKAAVCFNEAKNLRRDFYNIKMTGIALIKSGQIKDGTGFLNMLNKYTENPQEILEIANFFYYDLKNYKSAAFFYNEKAKLTDFFMDWLVSAEVYLQFNDDQNDKNALYCLMSSIDAITNSKNLNNAPKIDPNDALKIVELIKNTVNDPCRIIYICNTLGRITGHSEFWRMSGEAYKHISFPRYIAVFSCFLKAIECDKEMSFKNDYIECDLALDHLKEKYNNNLACHKDDKKSAIYFHLQEKYKKYYNFFEKSKTDQSTKISLPPEDRFERFLRASSNRC